MSKTSSFKLQFVSDLHIEFPNVQTNMPDIPETGNYLALLGDIGYPHKENYEEFLLELCKRPYEKIFVIAGNHEFYKAEYYETKERIAKICEKNSKLMFMDKNSYLVPDSKIRILGCTLWSYVPEHAKEEVGMCLNDYRLITIKDKAAATSAGATTTTQAATTGEIKERRLRVEDTLNFFEDELAWMCQQVKESYERKETVVILTHHAPFNKGTSAPQFEGPERHANHAFSTDLSYMMGRNIHSWCYGHTHYNNKQTIQDTVVMSNQLGYLHVRGEQAKYDPGYCLEVTPYDEQFFAKNKFQPFPSPTPLHVANELRKKAEAAEKGATQQQPSNTSNKECVVS